MKLERLDPKNLSSNPRASLSSWLRFSDIVLQAYRTHPQPFVFRPSNRSPSSIATKLRDAIRGKLAFDYPGFEIPNSDLLRWYGEVIVKPIGDDVYIGPALALVDTTGVISACPKLASPSFVSLSFEEVSAFQLLLSTGRLSGPILVQNPPDLTLLPERPNVELMPRADGSLVML